MPKAIWNFSYKLKKNVTQEQFIAATQRLHDEVISQAKGFVFWEQYLQGDTWTDLALWETLEDAKNAETLGHGSEAAKDFYALIQMQTCRALVSSLVKHYERPTGR